MDIVVNDTNIFIDLISAGLLEDTFRLPLKFHTVDMVVAEIKDDFQKDKIQSLIDEGCLYVKEFDVEEMLDIIKMNEERINNVSVTDCSVWYYAKKMNCRLLTGDKKLRLCANSDGVLVSGILFITDMLVDENIVSQEVMADKLELLSKKNSRLPKREINKRIEKYRNINEN